MVIAVSGKSTFGWVVWLLCMPAVSVLSVMIKHQRRTMMMPEQDLAWLEDLRRPMQYERQQEWRELSPAEALLSMARGDRYPHEEVEAEEENDEERQRQEAERQKNRADAEPRRSSLLDAMGGPGSITSLLLGATSTCRGAWAMRKEDR